MLHFSSFIVNIKYWWLQALSIRCFDIKQLLQNTFWHVTQKLLMSIEILERIYLLAQNTTVFNYFLCSFMKPCKSILYILWFTDVSFLEYCCEYLWNMKSTTLHHKMSISHQSHSFGILNTYCHQMIFAFHILVEDRTLSIDILEKNSI